jgi:2-phosphosulfolactate phosphatase
MQLEVMLTPGDVQQDRLSQRCVVVFDVLRATTTMTAALAAGVAEIRVFESLDSAAMAAGKFNGPRVLCGERNCLPPAGFDLGNSPAGFVGELHARRTVFISTTNGTRAIVAARNAKRLLIGAIINASSVARRLSSFNSDVTLLCAGTGGQPAMEDLLGAGAVIDELMQLAKVQLEGDSALMALRLFRACHGELRAVMAETAGGRNVLAVGLGADIDFAAKLDSMDVVGRVEEGPLRVVVDRGDRE